MMSFVNSFLSYGVLMLVTVAVCAAAVFLGITLRRRKSAPALAEGVSEAAPEAAKEEA